MVGLLSACQADPATVDDDVLGGGDGTPTTTPAGTTPPGEDTSSSVSPGGGNNGGGNAGGDGDGFINSPPPQPTATDSAPETGGVETVVMNDCAKTEVSAVDTTVLVPADIIIAVDTSASMQVETIFVQEQLNRFSQQIIDSGVDARVILLALAGQPTNADPDEAGGGMMGGGMMGGGLGGGGFGGRRTYTICIDAPLGSGSCPDDQNLPNYIHVNQLVDSRDSLTQIVNKFPDYREHLRPNSLKAFLVVTDDESNVPAATFVNNINQLHEETGLFERWTMNAVYAFTEENCNDADGVRLAQNVGEIYKQLVAQTSGVEGDLCLQDFQPVFDSLATQIVEGAGAEIVCEWEIPAAVNGQTFSTDLVEVSRTSGGTVTQLERVANAEACSAGGWYFDDSYSPQSIIACPSTCADMQGAEGRIDVQFGCEVVEGCAASDSTTLGAGEGAVACEWSLPEASSSSQQLVLDNVNVRYTTDRGFGVLLGNVPNAEACATAELGWHYDNAEDPTKIIACPATCEVLTARNVTQVQALFGCETKPAKPQVAL